MKIENQDMEKIYTYYIKEMSDLTYEEQLDFSLSTKVNLNNLIAEAQNIRDKFINGEETLEKYTEAQQRAEAAELEIEVFRIIDKQLYSMESLNAQGIHAKLIYSTGWKKLMQDSSNLLLFFAVLLLIIPYISFEKEHGFDTVLSGIFGGRKSSRRKFNQNKLLIAFFSSLLIVILFNLEELFIISSRYELKSFTSYAVGADIIFQNIHLKLIDALMLRMVCSIVGIIIIILIADVFTYLMKKTIFVILILIAIQLPLHIITIISNKHVLNLASYFSFELLYMSPVLAVIQTTVLIIFMILSIKLYSNHFHKTVLKIEIQSKR